MKKLFLLLSLVILTIAAKPPKGGGGGGGSSPWCQTQWTGPWTLLNAPGVGADLATFAFPTYTYRASQGRTVTSFLTTTTVTNLLGNLTGKCAYLTLSISTSGNPQFAFGGMLDSQGNYPGFNPGTRPANFRLFISKYAGTYSNTYADQHMDDFWWSADGTSVTNTLGFIEVVVPISTTNWSNASGWLVSDRPAEFQSAVANVRQIGLAFGGGSFFDTGVGVLEGTGYATFHLISFSVK